MTGPPLSARARGAAGRTPKPSVPRAGAAVAFAAAAAALGTASCGRVPVRATAEQVVVLGFDGADPKLLGRWMAEGKLPAFKRLEAAGVVQPLGTTEPPESPVAWASFATGKNPGKHGIFDFLKVDRATYVPDIGLVNVEKPKFLFHTIPVRRARLSNNRRGTPFYKLLADSGITTSVLRMPLAFPPDELPNGVLLSGLGVPDARRTWGTFFYFATDLTQWDVGNTEFGGVLVRLERPAGAASSGEARRMRAEIEGPYDPRYDDFRRLKLPVDLELTPDEKALQIALGGRTETVAEGSWSDWFDLRFRAGAFVDLRGISRFYVLETYPEVRLYLEPISLDPRQPPVPISSPAGFSGELASRLGLYKTLGWIHETWGLNEEKIDEKVFLDDLFRNMDALERAVADQMERRPAFLLAVFTATDSVSHTFFRFLDTEHPRYDPELAAKYGDAVERVYRRMDSIVGRVLDRLGERGTLLVVSDHGFHTWRREFNTNTWLARNGFLALQGSGDATKKLDDMMSGGSFFPGVDWSRTKAYSLGLGGVFVNLKGREGKGSVAPGEEYERVRREIADGLRAYVDPDNGVSPVQGVYRRDDIYKGPELEAAPDLIVSFRDGYRTSWQTALGAVPESIVVANMKKWSGDHCASDRSDTPGIFASNRRVAAGNYSIVDVAPTVLQIFGTPIPPDFDGRPIPFVP